MVVSNYLQLRSAGFPGCIVGHAAGDGSADLQQRLVQALLLRSPARPWVKAEMNSLLPGAGRAGVQALFRLLAVGVIEVMDAPGPPPALCLAGLHDDVQALAASRIRLVMLDADGFVLAHAGLTLAEAERWALAELRGESEPRRHRLTLQLGPRAPQLLAEQMPEHGHPAWLRLCFRLAAGCCR